MEDIIKKLKDKEGYIHILFVCSGNIIRSAYAEILFEKMLKDKYGETNIISESGALVYKNDAIYYLTRKALLSENVSRERIKKHKPRHIDYYPELFSNADIIFVFSFDHLEPIKQFANKTFLIYEFAFGHKKTIEDPFFTGLFDESFADIKQSLEKIIDIFDENQIIKKM